MCMLRSIFIAITAICLLWSSTAGSTPRWRCVDPDGTVTIEDAVAKAECCERHGEHSNSEVSASLQREACHDVAIDSGINLATVTPQVALHAPVLNLAFSIVLPSFHQPSVLPLVLAQPPDTHQGSPPLLQLASIILLV